MDKELKERPFDKNKPYLACNNCGYWFNITQAQIFLFDRLGYNSCLKCGSKNVEEIKDLNISFC